VKKIRKKKLVIELRKKGYSYSEISKRTSISKSTLSAWCKSVSLTKKQTDIIEKKRLLGAERGRIVAAKRKRERKNQTIDQITKNSIEEIGKMTDREFLVAGIGLYLGDGLKGDREVGFSNSNPKIITFMMKWLRKFCNVSEKDFRGQIWIHDNLDERQAKLFWVKLTKIPINQFRKSYISKNITNSKKIRKNIHKNGVFSVKVSNVNTQRKIVGWMAGIIKNVSV